MSQFWCLKGFFFVPICGSKSDSTACNLNAVTVCLLKIGISQCFLNLGVTWCRLHCGDLTLVLKNLFSFCCCLFSLFLLIVTLVRTKVWQQGPSASCETSRRNSETEMEATPAVNMTLLELKWLVDWQKVIWHIVLWSMNCFGSFSW